METKAKKTKKTQEETQWTDVLIRTNFSDSGKVPTSGSASHSPDIVPNGITLINDPVTYLTSDDNWMKDVGKNIEQSRQNFIYMRGINLHDGPRKGRFYLYYAPSSILLYPSEWKDNQLKTSSGQGYIEFDATEKDQRVATNQPFTWIPVAVSGHYCMIGRIYTEENPNPIPETGGITDFTKWILNHPNMAWRNVSMVSKDLPTYTKVVPYAQGDEGHDMELGIKWTNLPIGSYIAFSCGTPLPNGESIELPKTKITTTSGRLTIPAYVNKDWVTQVAYSYWSNGQTPTEGFKITFEGFYTAATDDELYDLAYPRELFGLPSRYDRLGGPIRMIPVGGDSIEGVTNERLMQNTLNMENNMSTKTEQVTAKTHINDVKWKLESRVFPRAVSYSSSNVAVQQVTGSDDFVYDEVSINHGGSNQDDPSYELEIDYVQDDVPGLLDFAIRCTDIPVGYSVALKCDQTGPNPPLEIGKTQITRTDMSIVATSAIPAGFKGKLKLYVWQNEKETTSGSKLTFQVLQPKEVQNASPVGIRFGSKDDQDLASSFYKVAQVVALLS